MIRQDRCPIRAAATTRVSGRWGQRPRVSCGVGTLTHTAKVLSPRHQARIDPASHRETPECPACHGEAQGIDWCLSYAVASLFDLAAQEGLHGRVPLLPLAAARAPPHTHRMTRIE